ncbi:MAG TPA: DUF2721 domain-containing protein [Methylovirgula sp.]
MNDLLPANPSTDQLARIIGNVAAPAFLLGAVASFISVLISRISHIIERSQYLHSIADDDAAKTYLKTDIPRLKRRAALYKSIAVLRHRSGDTYRAHYHCRLR